MLCWKRVMCWMDLSAVGVIVDRTTRPPPTVPRIAERSGIILDDERLSHSATAIHHRSRCTMHHSCASDSPIEVLDRGVDGLVEFDPRHLRRGTCGAAAITISSAAVCGDTAQL